MDSQVDSFSEEKEITSEIAQHTDKKLLSPVSQTEVTPDADENKEHMKEQEKLLANSFTFCEPLQMEDGKIVTIKIQTDKYFSFSKRCVRVGDTFSLPKLPANFTHGAHMFKLAKHDYNEEFEHLPRAGQKVGSHVLAELSDMQNKKTRFYNRLRQAYSCPRYLELWRFEIGDEMTVPITAELNWQTGKALSSHTSLGIFGKYFGRTFSGVGLESHSLIRKLNSHEAMFLADCGTLQVTASQCPLGVEDLLAILESKVSQFFNRYLVFSELHRITKFTFRTYFEEAKLDFIDPQTFTPTMPSSSLTQHNLQKKFKRNVQSQGLAELPQEQHCSLRGFFSEGPRQPRDLLVLPSVQTASPEVAERMKGLLEAVGTTETMSSTGQGKDGKKQSFASSVGKRDLRDAADKRLRVRGSSSFRGIDMAFFGCLKSLEWTPPLFDIAITNYRDRTVNVSDLFHSLGKRKNKVLPMLMERVDYGQVSGYALLPARVPAVEYIG